MIISYCDLVVSQRLCEFFNRELHFVAVCYCVLGRGDAVGAG